MQRPVRVNNGPYWHYLWHYRQGVEGLNPFRSNLRTAGPAIRSTLLAIVREDGPSGMVKEGRFTFYPLRLPGTGLTHSQRFCTPARWPVRIGALLLLVLRWAPGASAQN